jgi:formate-dependent phosphoribosylglycinamide formyltransferase (GAR transformylase)
MVRVRAELRTMPASLLIPLTVKGIMASSGKGAAIMNSPDHRLFQTAESRHRYETLENPVEIYKIRLKPIYMACQIIW